MPDDIITLKFDVREIAARIVPLRYKRKRRGRNPEKAPERRHTSVRLPADLWEFIETQADFFKESTSDSLERAVRAYQLLLQIPKLSEPLYKAMLYTAYPQLYPQASAHNLRRKIDRKSDETDNS